MADIRVSACNTRFAPAASMLDCNKTDEKDMLGEDLANIFGIIARLLLIVASVIVLRNLLKRASKSRRQIRQLENITRDFQNSEFDVDSLIRGVKELEQENKSNRRVGTDE